MRTDGVVLFHGRSSRLSFFISREQAVDLVELLGMGTIGAFDGAVEFGRTRGQHEQMEAALLTGEFEFGGELGPSSTCTARMGKGMRCCRVSRNWVAV